MSAKCERFYTEMYERYRSEGMLGSFMTTALLPPGFDHLQKTKHWCKARHMSMCRDVGKVKWGNFGRWGIWNIRYHCQIKT